VKIKGERYHCFFRERDG